MIEHRAMTKPTTGLTAATRGSIIASGHFSGIVAAEEPGGGVLQRR
jgi:hypothetical protein